MAVWSYVHTYASSTVSIGAETKTGQAALLPFKKTTVFIYMYHPATAVSTLAIDLFMIKM